MERLLRECRNAGEAPGFVVRRRQLERADPLDRLRAQFLQPGRLRRCQTRGQLRPAGQQRCQIAAGRDAVDAHGSAPVMAGAAAGRRIGFDPLVAALLELERELPATGPDDPTLVHHVHVVGNDVVQKPLVMRHQHDGVVLAGEPVHALGDDAQRVDVEARVGFVEDRQRRLEQGHLQNFVALLLAARKAFVDAAVEKLGAHVEQLHLLAHQVVELERVELVLAAPGLHGVVGQAQELAVADAGDLDRVLEREKDAGARALFRRQREQVAAFVAHPARGHRVPRVAGQHLRERALAGAVRPHDRVHFAALYDEVKALQDRVSVDARAQAANFEQVRLFGTIIRRSLRA
jgi:hypothetical protein